MDASQRRCTFQLNFDKTAENVVKVTCRRMQKDQFNQQVNNVGIGDKDSDKENL
jgi:hypothetical protein